MVGSLSLFASAATAETVKVQADGKILVAGATPLGSGYVARLLPDGRLDPTFGRNGLFIERVGGVVDIAVQPGGGILLLTDWDQVVRLGPEGDPDPGFGINGRAALGAMTNPAEIQLLPDGRIAVGGSAVAKFFFEALVATVSADGRALEWISGTGLGTTFGGMSLRADGSILVTANLDPKRVGLARFIPGEGGYENFYNVMSVPDSRPGYDKSFGGGAGLVRTRLPGDPVPGLRGGPIAQTETGVVVAAASEGHLVALGFDREGLPDKGFGRGGFSAFAGAPRLAAAARDAVVADGKVLVAGDLRPGSDPCTACATPMLARLRPDGRLDPTFGDGGIARLPGVAGPHRGAWGETVAPLGDGRVLVAGSTDEAGSQTVLGRFGPGGSPDSSFGTGGVVRYDPCAGSESRQRRVGCLPSATASLQRRRGHDGAVLRFRTSVNQPWAGIGSLRVRLPAGLEVREERLDRARVLYVDRVRRKRRVGGTLCGGEDLCFAVRRYEGAPAPTVEIPRSALRRVRGAPRSPWSFRLMVTLVSGSSSAGKKTFLLRG